jgi:Protein of unknown function (DUF2637)
VNAQEQEARPGGTAIRRSTIAAVTVVAIVAGFVSYRHSYQVVSEHGESGLLARVYPLSIDGLIYAASMVLLNAVRRGLKAPWLAWVALGLGIAATLAANVAAGLAFGVVGAIVAAWPAPALVISYELLMVVIRTSAPDEVPVRVPVPPDTPLEIPAARVPPAIPAAPEVPALTGPVPAPRYAAEAAEVFAADLDAGRVPGVKRLRQQFSIGQKTAQEIRDYLFTVIGCCEPTAANR